MLTHIPFYTTWHQVLMGPDHRLDGKAIVRNLHQESMNSVAIKSLFRR
jgi:hypothetical protein